MIKLKLLLLIPLILLTGCGTPAQVVINDTVSQVIAEPQEEPQFGATGTQIIKDIPLLGITANTQSTSYNPTTGELGITKFDPADYDPLTEIYFQASVYFELVGSIPPPDNQRGFVQLYNRTNSTELTAMATPTIAGNPTATDYYMLTSGDLLSSLTSTKELDVRIKVTDVAYRVTVSQARLLIVQNGTIKKTVSVYELSGYHITSATTAEETLYPMRALLDTTNFDGTLSYELHTTGNVLTGTLSVELYDNTNTAIRQTNTHNSATINLAQSAVTGLVDDSEHTIRLKMGAARQGGYVRLAVLKVKQSSATNITKTEIPKQVLMRAIVTSATSYSSTDKMMSSYATGDYSGITSAYYHEANVKSNDASGVSYASLLEDTTEYTSAEVNATGVAYSRQRSGSLAEPSDGNLTTINKTSASYSATCSSSRLIIVVTDIEVPVASARRIIIIN